uniref:Uncharacterized protein n=1 Tax=Picea glauca TaxID=3330 RepID=A0A101M1G7_PICGL|nr:hypothetical protein ABT39_MTgene3850 [Picea glauca]QHR86117.1 hypothetical protein Q903MT_gene116 [Picea sitchensis]
MSDFVPLPLVESSLPHPRPFWVESLNVPLLTEFTISWAGGKATLSLSKLPVKGYAPIHFCIFTLPYDSTQPTWATLD